MTELYAKGEVDAVYIIFSEFKSVMAPNLDGGKTVARGSDARRRRIRRRKRIRRRSTTSTSSPKSNLLDKLLPRYIETQILRAMLESSAAEYAARMTAMEAATKNAGEVIEALTLHMNKVRQAAITKEIIEIVSGASSTARRRKHGRERRSRRTHRPGHWTGARRSI